MGIGGSITKSNMVKLAGVLQPLSARMNMAGVKGEAVADATGNAPINAGDGLTVPTVGNLMMLDLRNIVGGTFPAVDASLESVMHGHANDLAFATDTHEDSKGELNV